MVALALAMILGVLAEDFRSAQNMIMPLMFMVMIPYFISLFADINTVSLPVKIFILAIPFSHPFLVSQNLYLGNYGMIAGRAGLHARRVRRPGRLRGPDLLDGQDPDHEAELRQEERGHGLIAAVRRRPDGLQHGLPDGLSVPAGLRPRLLGVDLATMSLALSARSASGALGPLLAPLTDRRGRRFGLSLGLGLFTAGAFLGLRRARFRRLRRGPRPDDRRQVRHRSGRPGPPERPRPLRQARPRPGPDRAQLVPGLHPRASRRPGSSSAGSAGGSPFAVLAGLGLAGLVVGPDLPQGRNGTEPAGRQPVDGATGHRASYQAVLRSPAALAGMAVILAVSHVQRAGQPRLRRLARGLVRAQARRPGRRGRGHRHRRVRRRGPGRGHGRPPRQDERPHDRPGRPTPLAALLLPLAGRTTVDRAGRAGPVLPDLRVHGRQHAPGHERDPAPVPGHPPGLLRGLVLRSAGPSGRSPPRASTRSASRPSPWPRSSSTPSPSSSCCASAG
ncbi:MAG: hypothetical protein M0C28_32330 [Candidatus Moduliflexus flocculans]|nr:hypothetical protein [Candidatus Moduliflexus flocculans]